MVPEEQRDQFRIKVDHEDNIVARPINGAFGSVQPDGTGIVAHFYYEFPSIPEHVDHEISKAGLVNLKEGKPQVDSALTRVVHSTFVFSPKVAEQVGKWLIQKSKEAASSSDTDE